jgi:hypothetical protein
MATDVAMPSDIIWRLVRRQMSGWTLRCPQSERNNPDLFRDFANCQRRIVLFCYSHCVLKLYNWADSLGRVVQSP